MIVEGCGCGTAPTRQIQRQRNKDVVSASLHRCKGPRSTDYEITSHLRSCNFLYDDFSPRKCFLICRCNAQYARDGTISLKKNKNIPAPKQANISETIFCNDLFRFIRETNTTAM